MTSKRAADSIFDHLRLAEVAAPSTPATGSAILYVKSDGRVYYKDDAGTEHQVAHVSEITGSAALQDLTDVSPTATDDAATGDVLTFDGSEWAPAAPSGGGGGATIQYGSLKPGTPDDDFTGASLTGWTAQSQAGSFALTDCFPQAVNGSYVQLGYHDKSGSIYKSQANADLDYRVGGFSVEGNLHPSQGQKMPGIAVLDSSGNGVALVFNTDLHTYLAEITAYAWTGTTYGSWQNTTPEYAVGSREYAMRITRATNTWTGYLSFDGVNWTAMSATGSKTITVDKVAIGTWKPNDGAARGRILADWMDVT